MMNKYLLVLLMSYSFSLSFLAANQGILLASDYQKNSNFQSEWAEESLKKFPFHENDKILDIGCGNGRITALIAKQVPHGVVIGLDISEAMISHASSNYLAHNLLFIQGTATSIPFRRQFDKLVCFSTLHWVLEQEQALQSFKDSLKPGGALLLVLPGKTASNLGPVSEKIAHSEKWSPYFPNFKQARAYYSPEEYISLLERVDLQIQSIEVSETITKFKDKAALVAAIRPLVNFIGHLPQALQEEFINDIATKQIQNSDLSYPDGSIGMQTIKIEVIALNARNG